MIREDLSISNVVTALCVCGVKCPPPPPWQGLGQ